MAIRISIRHTTEYVYTKPVQLTPQLIRLRPAPHTRTPLHHFSLNVQPADHFVNWQQDAFGNFVSRHVFPDPTRRLEIDVNVIADLVTINPFDFFIEDFAQTWPFEYPAQLAKELAPYFEIAPGGTLLDDWVASIKREATPTANFLVALNQRLAQDIGYVIRMEPGVQSPEETLKLAIGSCRDSGWLLVQIMRRLGLAARFVSGYLVQLKPDVESLDGPSGAKEDFTDLHAWTEVFVPGAGWIGLDPTSGLFAGEGHIPLACTPEPVSAAPITGAYLGDAVACEFSYRNEVTRIHEDPRVTFPYDDAQWASIMALGTEVDERLKKADVRLTMGGEPTFVSIDDMDSAQWNIAALGKHKLELATVLLRRLATRWAPGGVLHYGQGKWYPGEPLPRWALGCFWRTDGQPVWREPALLANPDKPGDADAATAERFCTALAQRLGIDPAHAVAGYEDALYYLWKEGSLPDNVDILDSKVRDPLERKRLRRLFDTGLDAIVGYALPVAWEERIDGWISSPWKFRREAMFLLPGDSPMGWRLPLDSLTHEPEEKRQQLHPADPFAERVPLPGEVTPAGYYLQNPLDDDDAEPARQLPADAERPEPDALVRTALCVEVRNGILHVFLPPLTDLGHWLALLAAVEACAAAIKQPLVFEGYEPPRDERLRRLLVTPDPGVIEVNVPPVADWPALVRQTEGLYEEARLSRLGTEKFMLDGRHTGTGGGNHVTLGGARAEDSPLLRRPHLLTSLITYWQHHPALSYLFSGQFIGPTSQAPRVDEARDDVLYELEIALAHLPQGESTAPWRVDRALRNLLVDITGNTHRAEFCIDKLYSPDTPTGRLGILEFRGMEMPPHWHMSAVQMLLMRCLVARFWDHPYSAAPVRWGTELHDRFMLPHFVERDIIDVGEDLRRWGFNYQHAWLAPFMEFRFPTYGRATIDDIELELRFAIEPWNVLGEEVTAQGTARFVDSSVERVQIKVTGVVNDRHLVTCNGRRLPLRATGRRGERVAGVRFKAWSPPSGLHPTIEVHTPLVFDLIDTWNGRSLGGCTYHVAHPGGRNYETLPINAYEAEARRLARFHAHGHTPGPVDIPPERPPGEFPYTLDLRHPTR
jgi:uncharacterized protein (DUF2126 family)/transglutaminase-like putative cysteine protease